LHLFEAYNIGTGTYWKGDFVGVCLPDPKASAVLSRRSNQKNFYPRTTDSFSG
jgi:hypothetical protein